MTAILLDMGLPRRAAEDLRSASWDVEHVGELRMHLARDEDIVAHARATHRVIVTPDHDFSRLVALSGLRQPSVIYLRFPRLTRETTRDLVKKVIPALEEDLRVGCIVVVTPGGVRVRRLPVR